MNQRQQLHDLGQSLWLDNISQAYDEAIRTKAATVPSVEAPFVELALEDLRRAAALSRPTFEATDGVEGWVSTEVSRLSANDTAGSIAARHIYLQADRAFCG